MNLSKQLIKLIENFGINECETYKSVGIKAIRVIFFNHEKCLQ